MSLRACLTLWRRTRCARRGHPTADWSPVVLSTGDVTTRAYRCAVHDRQPS